MHRVALCFLLVLAVGCGEPAKPVSTAVPTEGWTKHEVKEQGLTFETPSGWQIANEVNGKIEVKQDQEAMAQAKAIYDDIRMVSSASEPSGASKKLLTTYTIIALKPKAMPKTAQELLHTTLSDLSADYPKGDAKGAVFEVPSGPAVLTSYTDSATRGKSTGGKPEVVEVLNIQFRILHKDRVILLNVTGEKEQTEALQKLAESLLRRVSFG